MHRMNLVLDSIAYIPLGLLKIKARLKVQPELWRGIEETCKSECGVGGNATTLAYQSIDTRS